MTVNNIMKITLYTLIDITESGQRRGADKVAVGQQSNYDTLIQVIGLRSNLEPNSIIQHKDNISKLGFGTKYKGVQNYWEFVFEVPDGATSNKFLENDFDLVPIITSLTETAKINISVFKTKDDAERNIVFKYVDNN